MNAQSQSPVPNAGFQIANEPEFCAWLGNAMPGDACEYHRGFLVCDRYPDKENLRRQESNRIGALADRVSSLAAQGLVCLTQRRIGPEDFSYLAIKAIRPTSRQRAR